MSIMVVTGINIFGYDAETWKKTLVKEAALRALGTLLSLSPVVDGRKALKLKIGTQNHVV